MKSSSSARLMNTSLRSARLGMGRAPPAAASAATSASDGSPAGHRGVSTRGCEEKGRAGKGGCCGGCKPRAWRAWLHHLLPGERAAHTGAPVRASSRQHAAQLTATSLLIRQ